MDCGCALDSICRGDIDVDQNTYEIDMYFQNAIKVVTFFKMEERKHRSRKAWVASRRGIFATEFAITEGIGQIDQKEGEEDDESDN